MFPLFQFWAQPIAILWRHNPLSEFHRITCYRGSTVSLVCILLSQCIDVKSIQDIFSVSRDETLYWEGEISSCSFIFQPLLASRSHWRQPSNVIPALDGESYNKTLRNLKLASINLNPGEGQRAFLHTANCAPVATSREREIVSRMRLRKRASLQCQPLSWDREQPTLRRAHAGYGKQQREVATSQKRERPGTNQSQENCAKKSRPGFCEGPMHHDRIAGLSKIIIKSNLKSFRQWALQPSSAVQTDRRPGNCTFFM